MTMQFPSKIVGVGSYTEAYQLATGGTPNKPYAGLDVTATLFNAKLQGARGQRWAEDGRIFRWVRARGTLAEGSLLKVYTGSRTGTASAGSASSITTASTLLNDDIAGAMLSTTGGTGPNQFRRIYSSDETASASVLKIMSDIDNQNYQSDANRPETWATIPDATTTFSIYQPYEVVATSGVGDLVCGVSLGIVTSGNFTVIVEEGLVPALLVGSTDATTAGGLVFPSATAGTGKGPTTAGVTAAEAQLAFARSIDLYAGAAALRLIDLFGRFKQ